MSAQAHTQSGRFIRVYLLVWGLAAAGALTYLASLAWQVDSNPAQQRQQAAKPVIDPEQGLRVANKALAEIDNVQHTVGEIQKDLGHLKETIGQRDAQDRESQSRLAALEERVSTLATPPPPPVAVITVPSAKQKAADKAKAAQKRASEQRATSRIVTVVAAGTAGAQARSRPQARDGQHPGCSASRHHVRRARGDAGSGRPTPSSSAPDRRSMPCA